MEETKDKQYFTITIFAEHCVGILNQVLIIFTRRNINLESVSASPTTIEGVRRITICVWSDRDSMEKVVKQIEKRIDVLKAFLYTDEDIVHQEVALYKVSTDKLMKEKSLEPLIRHHNARILDITPEYTVIEKTGQSWETEALFEDLKPYAVKQFVRSGRVCVTRSSLEKLDMYLAEQKIRQERLCR